MARSDPTARQLLDAVVALTGFTLILTYALAVVAGRVDPWMPFISETPFYRPESVVFRFGLTLVATGFIPLAHLLYRRLEPVARELGGRWMLAHRLALACALAGSLFLALTANFTWLDYPLLHSIYAALFFNLFLLWAAVITALTWRGRTAPRARLRFRLAMVATGYLAMLAMGLTFNASGQRDQWGAYDPALAHNALLDLSALFEWVMIGAFLAYAHSLRAELRDVPLQRPLPGERDERARQ